MNSLGYGLSYLFTCLILGIAGSALLMFLVWIGISFVEWDWSLSIGRDERAIFLLLSLPIAFFMLPVVDSLRKMK